MIIRLSLEAGDIAKTPYFHLLVGFCFIAKDEFNSLFGLVSKVELVQKESRVTKNT